jgi:sigma-B regulation protein RsbQ
MGHAIYARNNVRVLGSLGPPLIFAHGFGSEQRAWRHQVAAFRDRYQIILMDHVGSGRSDFNAYSPERYSTIRSYAQDLLEICDELDLNDAILVGHSFSGMVSLMAAIAEPKRFRQLIFVKSTPRLLNDVDYVGGFEQPQLDALYAAMSANFYSWAMGFAPLAMNTPDMPELAHEFARTLSSMRPDIALSSARVVFGCDCRASLPLLKTPSLILQSGQDIAVADEVGLYMEKHIPNSQMTRIDARGHLPHLSYPTLVNQAIEQFLEQVEPRTGTRTPAAPPGHREQRTG